MVFPVVLAVGALALYFLTKPKSKNDKSNDEFNPNIKHTAKCTQCENTWEETDTAHEFCSQTCKNKSKNSFKNDKTKIKKVKQEENKTKLTNKKLKNYVWVKKFSITAHSKDEAIEQLKDDFDSDSVTISGRDLSVDLEYLKTENPRKYDIEMYEYMKNELLKNPKKLKFPIAPKSNYSEELD